MALDLDTVIQDSSAPLAYTNAKRNKFNTNDELSQDDELRNRQRERAGLAKFLQKLPIINVAQKHNIEIECDLGREEQQALGFYRVNIDEKIVNSTRAN